MPKGNSGRLVIEIDPELKSELYEALQQEGLTMKDWFLQNTDEFLKNRSQLSLLPQEDNYPGRV